MEACPCTFTLTVRLIQLNGDVKIRPIRPIRAIHSIHSIHSIHLAHPAHPAHQFIKSSSPSTLTTQFNLLLTTSVGQTCGYVLKEKWIYCACENEADTDPFI